MKNDLHGLFTSIADDCNLVDLYCFAICHGLSE